MPQKKIRSGIGGIEKSMAQKVQQTDKAISKAFTDLDALMESAKPMVKLANQISRKIKEKQGIRLTRGDVSRCNIHKYWELC